MIEIGNGDYGVYYTFGSVWTGYVEWDTGGSSPVFAREDIQVVTSGASTNVVIAAASAAALALGDVQDGETNVPMSIRQLREKVLEFQLTLGQALLFMHRWNEDDVEDGLATRCPYCRDTVYQQSRSNDPYCFGTGYLGGFRAAVVIYATLSDVLTDTFKLSPAGVLVRDQHPICSAPWFPTMKDGDMLIKADFQLDGRTVTRLRDRYSLREVTPVNPRGPFRGITRFQHRPDYVVSQNFQIDRLEESHPLYEVPLIFDSSALPALPTIAPGADPDSAGVPMTTVSFTFDAAGAVQGLNTTTTTTFPAE